MYIIALSKTITPINLYTGEGGVFEFVIHNDLKDSYSNVLDAKKAFLKYYNIMPSNADWDRKHTNFVFKNFTKPLISGTPPFAKIIKNK